MATQPANSAEVPSVTLYQELWTVGEGRSTGQTEPRSEWVTELQFPRTL